jgi:acetyltransferase-like isoleucine patch superfamily enzyme
MAASSRVTVYPGANVSGSVLLDEDVTVGSNAVVLHGLKVGCGTFGGAGAVVTRDLAPGA